VSAGADGPRLDSGDDLRDRTAATASAAASSAASPGSAAPSSQAVSSDDTADSSSSDPVDIGQSATTETAGITSTSAPSGAVELDDPGRERKVRRVAAVGQRLLESILATCRIRTVGEENFRPYWDAGKPTVFVLWHGRLLPCTYHHRHQNVVTLVSRHRDGEYIARIVERWGFVPVRGSSSRGGLEALRELMRWVRRGRSLAITPDGPRGPREVMKTGPLLIAQRTGAPIIPTECTASRAWFFGGWDRFLIPKPFSRITIEYGEPLFVPRGAGEAELEEIAREVERRMAAMRVRLGGAVAKR
jgi:lysophospholipid acyltransferase (LPLAT)-like uncharacterized protein